ncbi:MAG: VWA domain-containing protein [Gammaproteobacteria bacterium]
MNIPEQLHFMRPEAFYAFIPLLLFVLLYLTSKATSLSWKAVCDDKLLPYVLTAGGRKSSLLPMLLIIVATSTSIIALAGPVWKKLPQPVFREESALVIALDLSQSMHATDIKPSRVERAKLKVLDIIDARKGGQTALIVYAATAFTVTPLTDDDNTIANLVPALEPELMPAQGSNMAAALQLATELLQQAGITRGDVLLVTDGVSGAVDDAINTLTGNGHRLSIMGIGTAEGSPVPLSGGFLTDSSGAIVIPKLETAELQRVALQGNGLYVNMQADDSDISKLVRLFESKRVRSETEGTDLKADIWEEEGPWLLLLVLPIVALWPRKGWLLCLPLIALTLPQPAHALDMQSLWLRPDQQAMKELEAGNAGKAAELFKDNDWKAAAHYRAGNYEQSNALLEAPDSSNDYYNKGNVLAKLGSYQQAIAAYDQALTLDPDNEDARYNRDLVAKALEQQQRQDGQQQGQPQQQPQDQSSQDQSQQQSQSDQQDQSGNQQQQSEQADSNQRNQEERDRLSDVKQKQDEQDSANQQQQQENMQQAEQQQETKNQQQLQAQQQDEAIEQEDAETVESEQAMEQWLRRIPDDPGGLMRRKFIYQYRQMPDQAETEQPW